MARIESFDPPTLQAICDVLGDTREGLTGTEIGNLLAECNIGDPLPGHTKRYRLYEAFRQRQANDGCANSVLHFIQTAMNPVCFVGSLHYYESQRGRLNAVLAFVGLSLGEDGKLRRIEAAKTLSEAEEKAGRLRKQLIDRKVHEDVLRFCRAELLQDNYFHAVFEATKSVADKIRTKTGLQSDGSTLVDEAFGLGQAGYPRLAFNSLQTDTERSEHRGLMNLIKGLFGTFRNTTAHAPKIKWPIGEQDAMDILTLASLIHRRLDSAVRTHVP